MPIRKRASTDAHLFGLRPFERVFIASVALAAILIVATVALGLRRIPAQPVWQGSPQFDFRNAYAWTGKLARGYPNRVPWRKERAGAAQFLKGELRKLGYSPQVIRFNETIGEHRVSGLENIFAVLPAADPSTKEGAEYVVALAHYDITDTTVEGAADDASGVGSVLELARVFRNGPAPKRNIVFLLTDSEEFGAFWGAHNFVARFPHSERIVAAVSLDFVAPDKQRDILVLVDGLQEGYTPLWLRELALASIRRVPYPAADNHGALEFVQRALLIPPADHGAFLKAGVPALNFFGRSEDFAEEMGKVHHTPEDKMERLHPESFEPYGKSAEILLRSLDALPPMLERTDLRASDYWKLTETRYLGAASTYLIHGLLLLPYVVYVLLLLLMLKRMSRRQIFKVMRNETKSFGLIFVSFLGGYGCIRLLPELEVIAKYEMFPATQKSKFLYEPKYFALLLVLAVIAALYVVLTRVFKNRPGDEDPENIQQIRIRHGMLGVILGIILMLAFFKNRWLGSLFVLPPAYLWMYMKYKKSLDSRLLNVLLFLGGLVAVVAVAIAATLVFSIGVFYWYIFLSAAYGLITVYAAILALALITVGIRMLRNLIL